VCDKVLEKEEKAIVSDFDGRKKGKRCWRPPGVGKGEIKPPGCLEHHDRLGRKSL